MRQDGTRGMLEKFSHFQFALNHPHSKVIYLAVLLYLPKSTVIGSEKSSQNAIIQTNLSCNFRVTADDRVGNEMDAEEWRNHNNNNIIIAPMQSPSYVRTNTTSVLQWMALKSMFLPRPFAWVSTDISLFALNHHLGTHQENFNSAINQSISIRQSPEFLSHVFLLSIYGNIFSSLTNRWRKLWNVNGILF